MKWHQERLSCWTDFIEFIEGLKLNEQRDAGWYIRGQSNESWSLQPSLLRNLGDVTVDRALGIEFGATRRFMSEHDLHSQIESTSNQIDLIASWAIMQHYSCPTRLLDWTLSPYVALYFAVDQCPENDGAIWLFPSSTMENIMEKHYGKLKLNDIYGLTKQLESPDIKAVYPVITGRHNLRSASQQSVFTISTHVLSDHVDVISHAFIGQNGRNRLIKATVPAGLKNEFLSRLRTMNITPSSLFPGLDGLGRTVRDYIRLRAWRTHEDGS